MKKMFNISRRAIAAILCLCMMLAAMALISCNANEEGTDDANTETSDTAERVEVLRFAKNVKGGVKITAEDIETVSLKKTDVPINAMTNKDDVIGKYAASDLYKGDFITPSKLLSKLPEKQDDIGLDAEFDIDQILISKYASLANNGDYTEAIKTAIKENPGKTIYFTDGEYVISDTIIIDAESATGVSFRLANFATIKAASTWANKNTPMIRIGVEASSEAEDLFERRNTYIMGGIIDASDIATGIALEGGQDILLSNITIKNAYCGLNIKNAANAAGATYGDIENVNIVGNSEVGSVGVLVEGTCNTFTNMKISHAQYAVKCTKLGNGNVFKSIMAIGTGLPVGIDNAAFWDFSTGNDYDMCYSDQYNTGFVMTERTHSVYNACVVTWWSADNNYHVGFCALDEDGGFTPLNSTILYSKVYHDHTVATDAYILAAEGGEGSIQYPFYMIVSDTHYGIFDEYCNTDILG